MNHDTEKKLESIMNDPESYTIASLINECVPMLICRGSHHAYTELNKKPVFMGISDELLDYSLRGLEALKV